MSGTTELSRLRWRCRRGTRELDALLGWFLEVRYIGSSRAIQLAFDDLLDQQDPDLWDWLLARQDAPRAEWQEIIDAILARDRV